MDNMEKEEFKLKLDKCSKILIANDGLTLLKSMESLLGNPVLALILNPYIALYCNEVNEFEPNPAIDQNILKCIKDIRNGLKYPWDKYNRIINKISTIDNTEDEKYAKKLRFPILRILKAHFNLGIYVNETGKIIYNTHLGSYYLESSKLQGSEKAVSLQVGNNIGSVLMNAYVQYKGYTNCNPAVNDCSVKIGYIDNNTNRVKNIFSIKEDKNINLLYLHSLCTMNSYKYIFYHLWDESNTWKLRMEYISSHMVWEALNRLVRHFEQNPKPETMNIEILQTLVEKGKFFFTSSIRKCMMHYGFYDDHAFFIDENNFSNEHLFFGLFESTYDGMSCMEYFYLLRKYMNEVEEYLNVFFSYDLKEINYDL